MSGPKNLAELSKESGMTDEELIKLIQEQLGIGAEDAALMLAIDRGEVDGDIIEEEEQ